MSILDDWREAAAQPRGVAPGGSGTPWTVARLVEIDEDANRAVVSINGSQPVALPFEANNYEGVDTVFVALDPLRTGAGQRVTGPCGVTPEDEPDPDPVPPPPSGTVTVGPVTILPTWSGTWSAKWSRYGAWQPSRYGGVTTLYQGNKYGSGNLTGVAVYGNQIAGLGASSIVSMSVRSLVATSDTGTPTFQGTAAGTRPSGAPATVGSGTASGTGWVNLVPSGIAEAMRVGAIRGLVAVGSDYLGVYGQAHPSGMALVVTFTRPA